MSCRSTHGGTVATRLARAYSGLPDRQIQSIFHALKREGATLPEPDEVEIAAWKARQNALIANSKLSERKKAASERDLLIAQTETVDPGTFHAWTNVERRARQQAVIRSLKGNVADLAPPGSQIDDYEWGSDGRPARVWYASYGSNMDRDRFLTYVQGGTPDGSYTKHAGCRDNELPHGDIPIRYRGRMHFAYNSRRWENGGVAFLDNDGVSHALGRAYNVSMEQFDDIVAQENGSTPGLRTTPADATLINGHAEASKGVYGTMVHIGDYNGAPVFTFTGDFTAQEALEESFADKPGFCATNEPSPNYIRMVASGLADTFDMSLHEQADYLRGCPGMEDVGRRKILKILRTPPDPVEPPKPTYRSRSGPSTASRAASSGGGGWMDRWDRANGWGQEPTDAEIQAEADRWAEEYSARMDEDESRQGGIWGDMIAEHRRREATERTSTNRAFGRYDDDDDWGEPPPEAFQPRSKKTTRTSKKRTETYTHRQRCFYCDGIGHKMNDCPTLKKK